MVKHGTSHAGAVLVSFVSSGLLVRYFYDELPRIYIRVIDRLQPLLAQWGISLSRDILLTLLPLMFLSFVWGMAFKLMHRDEAKSDG